MFAEDGEIRIAENAHGVGLEGITSTLQSTDCPTSRQDGDMTLHHVTQPVIRLADDGTAARFAARLWEVHVSTGDENFYRGGMVEGEARYDDGRWKLSSLDARYLWTAPIIVQ